MSASKVTTSPSSQTTYQSFPNFYAYPSRICSSYGEQNRSPRTESANLAEFTYALIRYANTLEDCPKPEKHNLTTKRFG